MCGMLCWIDGVGTLAAACVESWAEIATSPPQFGNHAGLRHGYLIASGLTGDPTAPVIGSAGATTMNS
jgi:hypothetical protein